MRAIVSAELILLLSAAYCTGADPPSAPESPRSIQILGPRHLVSDEETTLTFRSRAVPRAATAAWALTVANSVVAGGTLEWRREEPHGASGEITIPPADVRRPVGGKLLLQNSPPGETPILAFPIKIYPPVSLPLPPSDEEIFVPASEPGVQAFLERLGYSPRKVRSIRALPDSGGVLVLRPPSEEALNRSWPSVAEYVTRGGRVLLFVGDGGLLRVSFSPPGCSFEDRGESAPWNEVLFPDGAPYPWGGVEPVDLAGWRPDGTVAEGGISWDRVEPDPKILAWAQPSGEESRLPVLVDFTWGRGRCLVCRLRIPEKIEQEPVVPDLARRLIGYGAKGPAKERSGS